MNAVDPVRLVAHYRYELDPALIAKNPVDPPDSSRLLVVTRDRAGDGYALDHRHFYDLPSLLDPGDLLVVNETRVIAARLRATREHGGGAVEVMLLHPLEGNERYDPAARRWRALLRPARRCGVGTRLRFDEERAATVVEVFADGGRALQFDDGADAGDVMARHGSLPLPPYVGRGDAGRRYQTMFARVPGSVAAPTASLHFTPNVLAGLAARDIELARIVLDVGQGTFAPMSGETIDEHHMHTETYEISDEAATTIERARRDRRKIVAVGTTTLRAIESAARARGAVEPGVAQTDLFVTPGFPFRVVDRLVTNFHLPASTLLVLVSAFAGDAARRAAYESAIERRYRFFSFGDAMLVDRVIDN